MAIVASATQGDTIPVRIEYELDAHTAQFKIGLIALATDQTVERDFRNVLPTEAPFFVSRVANINPCTVENLRTMAPQLTSATSLILPGADVDVVAYCCTSGTVAIGYDNVVENIQAARPGVCCTTPITAALAGFEKLGLKRIAVLTPYIDEVNRPIRRFLEENGINVLSLNSFNLEDDVIMGRIPTAAIYAAAREIDRPDADGIFISCTAIRAVDVIERLEQDLGKPVLSSNQALAWQALRLAGCHDSVPGFGRLLREH
jgi:maleate isomerase